jgi:hypothetical protein
VRTVFGSVDHSGGEPAGSRGRIATKPWLVNQKSRTASFWTDLIMTLGALSSFRVATT